MTASILDQLRTSIEEAIPGATVQVNGGGGHYTVSYTHLTLPTIYSV